MGNQHSSYVNITQCWKRFLGDYVLRFVVAIDKERASSPAGVALFRSYPRDDSDKYYYALHEQYRLRKPIKIWEAARATAAAPTYFKAQRIGVKDYV